MRECFVYRKPKNGSFTFFFSEEDRLYPESHWLNQLVLINKKHLCALQDPEANYFIIDEEFSADAEDAFIYINGLMEGALQFIRMALFPDVWKFGIACIRVSDSMVKMGLYRISINQTNKRYIRRFDTEDRDLIGSMQSTHTDLKEFTKLYVHRFIELFFSMQPSITSVKYFPNMVLRELIFEGYDILTSLNCEKKLLEGEMLPIEKRVTLSEVHAYFKLQREPHPLIDLYIAELEKQSLMNLERVWRTYTRVIGKTVIEQLDHSIFLNAEQLDLSDDIAVTEICILDKKETDAENRQSVLQHLQSFYSECCKKFGDDFSNLIGKKQKYIVELAEENEPMEASENFIFVNSTRKDIHGDETFHYHYLQMRNLEYSWYKLWRVLFRNMTFQYLGIDIPPVMVDYIASK